MASSQEFCAALQALGRKSLVSRALRLGSMGIVVFMIIELIWAGVNDIKR